ncbi:MAG: hypothetical protein ACREM3_03940 [Candidatus Rokuibacteriota bacterium]
MGTFVLPPPAALLDETPWRRLAQVVAAVLIGLMFVATRRWRARGRAPWAWLALASLVLAVLATFGYDYLTRAWSCRYDDRRVIVGADYTEQARAHRQRDPGASCERLIQDFAGRLDDVWVGEGIRRRHSVLAALYVGAVALFTICLVTVVEAIARAERPARRAGGARRR